MEALQKGPHEENKMETLDYITPKFARSKTNPAPQGHQGRDRYWVSLEILLRWVEQFTNHTMESFLINLWREKVMMFNVG